jgi:hypothetical protein
MSWGIIEWVLPCCYRGVISRHGAAMLSTNETGPNGSGPLESPRAVVSEDHAMLLSVSRVLMLFLQAERCDGLQDV